jgi:hypothetical protein
MPRTVKGGGKGGVRQDVKAIERDVSALQREQRRLLKDAGQSIREFRKDVARLKKLGVVSKRQDVRHQEPTKYMRGKVRKFGDVLRGEAIPVRAPKAVRETYREKGLFATRGGFVIVPKDQEGQRSKIRRGLIENIFPLGRGEMREVILPYRVADMVGLVQALKSDPSLDGRKEPTEMFAFRLYGHNSRTAFVDSQELIDYIETKYTHLFKGVSKRDAFKHFTLVRFKGEKGSFDLPAPPESGKVYSGKRRHTPTGRSDGPLGTYERLKLERAAAKKAKQRERETPEHKRERLDKQRDYQRDYRKTVSKKK